MINAVLFVVSFIFMEGVAWSNHKYIMHGFLWKWHKDHHTGDRKKVALEDLEFSGFEKNDLFFLIYSVPAIILIVTGLVTGWSAPVFIGAGITLYGFTYFLVHDVVIHQRIHIPFLRKNHFAYTRAIIRAHLAHHRPKSRSDFRNYGLLLFPVRFFKE